MNNRPATHIAARLTLLAAVATSSAMTYLSAAADEATLPVQHAAARVRSLAALQRLRMIDPDLGVEFRPDYGAVVRLRGRLRPPDSRPAEEVARAFLVENADLFGLSDVANELRLDPKRTAIRPAGERRSKLTFCQVIAGHDVEGRSLRVHLDHDGSVRVVHGRIEPELGSRLVAVRTPIGIDQVAVAIQNDAVLAAPPIFEDAPRLLVLPSVDPPTLAFEAFVSTADGLMKYHVAAADGRVLDARVVSVHEKAYTGYGYDPFGVKRKLHTSRSTILGAPTGDYKLWFDFHKATVHGYDITGDTSIGLLEDHCTDSNNQWASTSQEAETAAWFNIHQVLEYFYSVHGGWDSFDGDGGKIELGLHASFTKDDGSLYDANASGEGFGSSATIKIGDGTDLDGLPLSCLDVVAHEFTHAMLHSLGVETGSDQSAALHEGVSDVFGLFVEKRFGNAHGSNNFRIGEEAYIDWAADEIRDIANPARDHYFDFEPGGDPHDNSTILSHAAYLMWKGGNHDSSGFYVNGIGHQKCRKVWFNALVDYLNETEPSFLDMRYALEDAAEEIGGEVETAVERAFNAIGTTSLNCDLAAALKGFDGFVYDKGSVSVPLAFYTLGANPAVGLLDAELEDGSDAEDVLVVVPPTSSSQSVSVEMRVLLGPSIATFEPHLKASIGFTKKAATSAMAAISITVTPYDWGTAVPSDAVSKTLTVLNNGSLGTIDIDLRDLSSSQALIRLEVTDLSNGCGAVAFPELRLDWN